MHALVDAARAGEGRRLAEGTTHEAFEVDGCCVKLFVDAVRDECAREWEALWVAHRHAPDAVPRPLWHGDDAIVMTLVPGRPVTAAEVDLDAYVELHQQLAAIDASSLRPAILTPEHALERVLQRRRLVTTPPDDGGAFVAAGRWLECEEARSLATWPLERFGRGDPNPRNLLWDGDVLRAVDFEDAGRTSAVFQLADQIEHLEMHDAHPALFDELAVDMDRTKLRAARRMIAIAWYGHLLTNVKAQRLNPPERAARQAARVLNLLG